MKIQLKISYKFCVSRKYYVGEGGQEDKRDPTALSREKALDCGGKQPDKCEYQNSNIESNIRIN